MVFCPACAGMNPTRAARAPESDPEPTGWMRHPPIARRRPNGRADGEYILKRWLHLIVGGPGLGSGGASPLRNEVT